MAANKKEGMIFKVSPTESAEAAATATPCYFGIFETDLTNRLIRSP